MYFCVKIGVIHGTSAFISCPNEMSSFNTKMESKSTAALKQFERSFTNSLWAEKHLIIAKFAFASCYCNHRSVVV